MMLTILKQEWQNKDQFPSKCNWQEKQTISFKKYTDLADYLDAHKELKNKVMIVRHHNQVLGKKVIFNDFIFVEGYGFV